MATLADVDQHVRSLPAGDDQALLALYIGRGSNLLATEIFGRGHPGGWAIKPMRIIRQALKLGAIGLIMVHHDRGRTLGPRAQEIRMAQELRRLGEDLEVPLFHYLVLDQDRMREIAV